MANREIVIKIPEKEYEVILNNDYVAVYACPHLLSKAIKNGTPLPKGHGRIGDLDALRCENADFDTYNDYCLMFDEIDNANTIIEADKESEEHE